MRSTLKFAVPLAVAALALGACGTKGGETPAPGGSGGAAAAACDQKIGMFGALTGPNANLGIYIQNGVNLALDDYNKENPNCKVTLENYDSQGDPTQAPALAKKAIDDKKVVGIVGPAFSGESKAADPAFNEAGLVTITPSATGHEARLERVEDLLPRPRQRRHAGPRGRQVHQGHRQVVKGLRHRRRVRVRQGPGRHRPQGPRRRRWSATTPSSRSRPTSAPPSRR